VRRHIDGRREVPDQRKCGGRAGCSDLGGNGGFADDRPVRCPHERNRGAFAQLRVAGRGQERAWVCIDRTPGACEGVATRAS